MGVQRFPTCKRTGKQQRRVARSARLRAQHKIKHTHTHTHTTVTHLTCVCVCRSVCVRAWQLLLLPGGTGLRASLAALWSMEAALLLLLLVTLKEQRVVSVRSVFDDCLGFLWFQQPLTTTVQRTRRKLNILMFTVSVKTNWQMEI